MNYRPNVVAMRGYTPGEQPPTDEVVKLNTNENPYPCSPQVRAAIGRAVQRGLQRYPSPLGDEFRTCAAEVLDINADSILCGNGSDDLLTILTRAFVPEGGTICYPTPGYLLYETLAEIQGANTTQVSYQQDWSLGDDFISASAGASLALIANPNSPSGTTLAPSRLAEIAEALPCPLVIDEAYADFAAENCLALVKEIPNVIVTRTLSKSYALAGLRFGYLVAQPAVIEQLRKVKDSYNCDSLSIAGAAAAIGDQEWLEVNRQNVLATRERLRTELINMGFDVPPSQANFVWATHQGRPLKPLYSHLKERGILVRYLDYPNWGDGLRMSVGTDPQIDLLLNAIQEFE